MVEHYRKMGKVKALKIDGYEPTNADAVASKNIHSIVRTTSQPGKGRMLQILMHKSW